MPFAPIIYGSQPAMPAYVSRVGAEDEQFRRYFDSDAIHSTINEVRVGDVIYPLRRPCDARFVPGIGEFLVGGFSPIFVGRGSTSEEARKDWELGVHAAFQELLHKRPFELSEEQRCQWTILSSRIDVTVYRNQTPIQVRQFGQVAKCRPNPQQILWENGKRETIEIEQVACPDFITFKAGQPIEAIVARDPVDYHLLRIVHIVRRPAPSRLPVSEETKLLESIGSSTTLPDAGWE